MITALMCSTIQIVLWHQEPPVIVPNEVHQLLSYHLLMGTTPAISGNNFIDRPIHHFRLVRQMNV